MASAARKFRGYRPCSCCAPISAFASLWGNPPFQTQRFPLNFKSAIMIHCRWKDKHQTCYLRLDHLLTCWSFHKESPRTQIFTQTHTVPVSEASSVCLWQCVHVRGAYVQIDGGDLGWTLDFDTRSMSPRTELEHLRSCRTRGPHFTQVCKNIIARRYWDQTEHYGSFRVMYWKF